MNILILLAGGVGSRMEMGTLPKQYLLYEGKPIIIYSLKTFELHNMIDQIIIVADKEYYPFINEWMKKEKIKKFYSYAEPGENRQLSILNGLIKAREFADDEDVVIIHDAARPLVSKELIARCLESIENDDGVVPVLPAKDTYYLLGQERSIDKLLPRARVVAGQAPEAFKLGTYYYAHQSMDKQEIMKINGSTELAILCGLSVRAVQGEERNFKITTQDDLLLMKTYMEEIE